MTNQEAMEKAFTSEQIDWILDHKLKGSGTQEQKIADLAEQLFSAGVYEDEKDGANLLNLSVKPKRVYSVKDILATVSPTTKVDSNAINQFIEDWNEGYRGEHGKGRLNVTYGPGSMENADKVMKQAYADKHAVKQNQIGLANKLLGTLLYPRSLEAMKAGKEVGTKDMLLDAAEDIAMMLPLGWWASLPKAARAFKGAKVVLPALSAMAVPGAMELADAAAYEPEENLDRSKPRFEDFAIGSLTNAAAPFVLGRGLSKLKRYASVGETAPSGLTDDVLRTLGEMKAKGQWVQPTKETLADVSQANLMRDVKKNMSRAQYAGVDPYRTEGAIKSADQIAASNVSRKDYLEAGMVEAEHRRSGKPVEQILGFKEVEAVGRKSKIPSKTVGEIPTEYKQIHDYANEKLKNASWLDKMTFEHPVKANLIKGTIAGAQSFGTNRYGSNRDADVILSGLSNLAQGIYPGLNLSKSLKESRAEDVKAEQKQLEKKYAKSVLDNLPKDASDDDKKFMKMVVDNPDVLKGMGKGNTPAFRNWYLLRGSDILRGTELYRPTFEVE